MGIRFTAAAILLLTVPSVPTSGAPASGAELPRYDVSGHCGRVAVVAGTARRAEMREACERREQEAHETLSELWTTLPRDAQGRCLWATRTHGENYATLQDCVRLELEAAERRRRRGS